MITLQQQLACAKRELALRRRVYPRLIQQGKLAPNKSEEEIACMEAIVKTLDTQQDLFESSQDMKDKYAK